MGKSENKVLGIVGALIGIAIALVLWGAIGRTGNISWIGGLALAAGAYGGYRVLGHELSNIGIIICSVLLLVGVYAGTRLAYSTYIQKQCEDDSATALAVELLGFDSEASFAEIYVDFDDYVDAFDEIIELANEYGVNGGDNETLSEEFNKNLTISYVVTLIASVAIVVRMRKM